MVSRSGRKGEERDMVAYPSFLKGDVAVLEKEIELKEEGTSPSQWFLVWLRLQKNTYATVSLGYLLLNVLIAVFYPLFIPNNPVVQPAAKDRLSGGGNNSFPNLRYPFGTDPDGRNTFSNIMAGAETSLIVGIVATFVSLLIGISLGLVAGLYGGLVEELSMRLTDIFIAMPSLIIIITLIHVILSSPNHSFQKIPAVFIIIIALGIFGWAGTARLVTATVKQVADLEYVRAARVLGASNRRIMVIHVLPNVLASIIVVATMSVGVNILSEAGITFLGIGGSSTTVSWGILVSIAQREMSENPYLLFISAAAIFFLVLAINIFGDALRDALDPRLKE